MRGSGRIVNEASQTYSFSRRAWLLGTAQATLGVALVGAALTYLYLLTGRLWVVMLVHVAIDLNALILRPWMTR